MYRRILAFNFDGTLAENGMVPLALQTALEQLHAAGYALFMVTGRRFGDAELGSLEDVFTGIAWENGAVLHHITTDEVYLPFGHIDPRLVVALELAQVPLEHGRAIVSTGSSHDETVWQVLSDWGGDAVVWGLTPTENQALTPLGVGAGPRIFPGMHRLHRYLEDRVASSRQFYFHDQAGHTLPAGNLGELIERVQTLDQAVVSFHFQRGDFARWIRDVIHDETLARWLDRLHAAELSGEALRLALLDALEQRLCVLERLI